jgi:flagellar FliL protein
MSAAAAQAAVEVPPKKRPPSKKLIIMLAAVVLLLAAAGGGALFWLKHKAAQQAALEAEAEGEDAAQAEPAHAKKERKGPPNFLPLDPFVVNLADREQERYAQIGVTLQVDDAKAAEELKLYMPAIRNGVLMILAHKTSAELLERSGKEQLAEEIMREAVRPLGIELEPPAAAASGAAPKKRRAAEPVHNPVEHVHFSSFIIQ